MRRAVNKLFLILAILVSLSSVQAQSHDKEPAQPASKEAVLTERLVFVFEWILDAHFNSGERARLLSIVEEYSRSSNTSDQQALRNIADLQQKIDSIPEEKVAQTRAAIQAQVLKEMRKQPNDPTAQLIISVYERTHNTSSINQPSQEVVDRQSTRNPRELVGQWIARRGSVYQNPHIGS